MQNVTPRDQKDTLNLNPYWTSYHICCTIMKVFLCFTLKVSRTHKYYTTVKT